MLSFRSVCRRLMPSENVERPGQEDGIITIPNEILSKIFESAQVLWYCNKSAHTSATLAPEVVLPAVCGLWRELSHSVPGLWTSFHLLRPSHRLKVGEVARLQTYLSRSKNEELDLIFDMNGLDPGNSAIANELLTLIVPHLHRIWRLVIHGDQNTNIIPFYKDLRGVAAPRLQHFEVCTGLYHNYKEEGYDSNDHWDPRILTKGLPSIRYLKLDSSASGRFRAPMQSLVHFSYHPGRAAVELLLLWQCLEQVFSLPFIETISIWDSVIASPARSQTSVHRIEAKRLKHLRIGMARSDEEDKVVDFVLNSLSAPTLETLIIHCAPGASLVLVPSADFDASPPFPSLKALYLLDVVVRAPAPWAGTIQLAHRTRFITHLSITTKTLADSDFGFPYLLHPYVTVLAPTDSSPLWPRVQTLDLNVRFNPERMLQRSMSDWDAISTVRLPFRVLKERVASAPAMCAADGPSKRPVEFSELTQLLPDWPPNYDFPSQVATDDFCHSIHA